MAKIKIFNENCFDTMERMEKKDFKVDIILTSPPYNTARTCKTKRSIENYENRYDIHLDSMTDEEYGDWTKRLFDVFDNVLSDNGVILYNISYGSECPDSFFQAMCQINNNTAFQIADIITWKKKSALPNNVSPNKLTRITEFVFVICRRSEYKTYRANKKVKSVSRTGQKYYENIFNFIEAANNDGPCELNKATFSTDLCLQLLEMYSDKDCVVFDPFMGTGTTAVACERYGSDKMWCFGSELSEKQVAHANERIETFRKRNPQQPSLFPELDEPKEETDVASTPIDK